MDETRDGVLALKAIVVVVVFAALAFPAREHFGEAGVSVMLFAALAVVVLLMVGSHTGRPLLRLAGSRTAVAPPVEDVWRSERWVREAVERGIRAIDDWRHDQTA